MVSLVNALLSVSRMDLGTFVLESEPTDTVLLVRNIVREQKPQIDRKKIKFSSTSATPHFRQKTVPAVQPSDNIWLIRLSACFERSSFWTMAKRT